jgi:hypothetical protein
MNRLLRHLTYANVISTLALFLVLAGGSALAAKALHRRGGLRPNSVNSRTVKDNTLQSADLQDGAAVSGTDVLDRSLGPADLANDSFDSSRLASKSVGGHKLVDGSVVAGKLAARVVTKTHLRPGSVNGSKVVDGSLTAEDIGVDQIDSNQIDLSSFTNVSDAKLVGVEPFARGVEELTGSRTVTKETPFTYGEQLDERVQRQRIECPEAGHPIAGSVTNLRAGSEVVNNGPVTEHTWEFTIFTFNEGPDDFSAKVLCIFPGDNFEH